MKKKIINIIENSGLLNKKFYNYKVIYNKDYRCYIISINNIYGKYVENGYRINRKLVKQSKCLEYIIYSILKKLLLEINKKI